MSVKELLVNPKTVAAVSTVTTSSGLSTWFEWIPSDIGKVAVVIGILLSSVLIYFNVVNGIVTNRKLNLELKLLRDEEKERENGTD